MHFTLSPKAEIKVLFFSHGLDLDGASISLKELVLGLKKHCAIQASVFSYSPGPLQQVYEAHGIQVSILPSVIHRISTQHQLDRQILRLSERIAQIKPDLVFANTLFTFLAIMASEQAGCPSIWNPRESDHWRTFFRLFPPMVAQRVVAAIGLPRRVVFVSEATRAVWSDYDDPARFVVSVDAIAPNRFLPVLQEDREQIRKQLGWQADELVYLTVGPLWKLKGQHDCLLALGRIESHLKVKIRWVCIGDASRPYAQRLRRRSQRFKRLGLIQVDFVSSTQDIGRYYRGADALVQCSRTESYPRVILEGMMFRLPLVTTPVYGVREQLPEQEDALFYEPGKVHQLASRLLTLSHSSQERQRLSNRSHMRWQQLPNHDQLIRNYEQIIRHAVQF